MKTAGQRLVELSGLSSATAAQHLLALRRAGNTAGEILFSRSSLASGAAIEHLADAGFADESNVGQVYGGGLRYSESDIRRLIEDKWEAIERSRSEKAIELAKAADAKQVEQQALQPPALVEPDDQAVPFVGIALPGALIPNTWDQYRPPPLPLGPTKAELAREARRRNDEEALIQLLAELL